MKSRVRAAGEEEDEPGRKRQLRRRVLMKNKGGRGRGGPGRI